MPHSRIGGTHLPLENDVGATDACACFESNAYEGIRFASLLTDGHFSRL